MFHEKSERKTLFNEYFYGLDVSETVISNSVIEPISENCYEVESNQKEFCNINPYE